MSTNATQSTPLYYTKTHAGKVIGVSRPTVTKMIASGQLRSVKIADRDMVPHAALMALVQQATA